jgi:hypothetical protein
LPSRCSVAGEGEDGTIGLGNASRLGAGLPKEETPSVTPDRHGEISRELANTLGRLNCDAQAETALLLSEILGVGGEASVRKAWLPWVLGSSRHRQ